MKPMIIVLLLVLVCPFISEADTIQKPFIALKEGYNKVSLAVVNKWDNNLINLKCSIRSENLPEWLKITNNSPSITIEKDSRSNEFISLLLEVTNPPENSFFEVPYTLTDEKGNSWYLSFRVGVNGYTGAEKILDYTLFDNFPNPFNPTTIIRYSLKENIKTKLVIYNMLGQSVKVLADDYQKAGTHKIEWDSKDNNGNKVASGIYFYRLTAGSFVQTKKMVLIQ
jgi:hypothetical protein